MGYLDNSIIVIDAILTQKGRELLAKGTSDFKITQFALSDDEIDYGLWNPNHPNGSLYYGEAIENMPILEATSDENQALKYKLLTLPRGTTRIPVITVGATSIVLAGGGSVQAITPHTLNILNGNATYGYAAILGDSSVCDLIVTEDGLLNTNVVPSIPEYVLTGGAESIVRVGTKFELIAKEQPVSDGITTLTIIGNETGGRITINVKVNKTSTPRPIIVPGASTLSATLGGTLSS